MMTNRRQALLLAAAAVLTAQGARASERIVTDPITGLALSGHDPVAYFLHEEAREGSPEHEARWSGTVWRFLNEGNRAAFLDTPQVYAPQFGGHDPVSAARGFVARGEPDLFVLLRDRLYLFHTPLTRRTFIGDAAALLAQAETVWPRLEARLAR